MTRAGEKLYGDWEKRIGDAARPFPWKRIIARGVVTGLAVVIGCAALFGFG